MAARDEEGTVTRYDYEGTYNPKFKTHRGLENDQPYIDLMLQLFRQVSGDAWESLPEDQWHLLARIFPEKIVTFPIHTRVHAQRYRSARHGTVTSLTYQLASECTLPNDPDSAVSLIERTFDDMLFNSCASGLGLVKELDPMWSCVRLLQEIDALVVMPDGTPQRVEQTVWISETQLEDFRRAFIRSNRFLRKRIDLAKKAYVLNELLTKLDPQRFGTVTSVDSGECAGLAAKPRSAAPAVKKERRARLANVKREVSLLAQEAPRELLELRAEIERVTLAKMIEKYKEMLGQALPEMRWQRFFEDNIFILSIVFARPVSLLHTQFHARGSQIDGSGAHVGDLLFSQGQALAIVEIKKPSTSLMQSTAYRNTDVYAPDTQLSGAVTQVLYQQNMLRNHWLIHQSSALLQGKHPDTTRCVVIAGITPTEPQRLRSFEVFRNACKDVEVVTFDELLGKLQLLAEHLSPKAVEPAHDLF